MAATETVTTAIYRHGLTGMVEEATATGVTEVRVKKTEEAQAIRKSRNGSISPSACGLRIKD